MLEEEKLMADIIEQKNEVNKTRKWFFILLASFFTLSVFGWCLFNYLKAAPADFPVDEVVAVPAGSTVQDIAKLMKANNFIKSELFFFAYFKFFQEPVSLKASDYSFTKPLKVDELIAVLAVGDYSMDLIKFTHIEGERVESVAKAASAVLPDFDENKFLDMAKSHEGKLFPETYFIPSNFSEEQLLELLLKTFQEKTESYEEQISAHDLSLDEIIILASILEREANTKESKQMVAGILDNRLSIGMPLQVDASIEYVLDKPLSELTPEDLKIESPYNTYLNTGLPPTPIGNPGLEAIEAIISPTVSDYLFYITGNDGNFYYAKNFDEHRLNIARYLR